jgi:hypothetical protein
MKRRVLRFAAILLCALLLTPVPAHPQDPYYIVCWYQGTWTDGRGVKYDSWFCIESNGAQYWEARQVQPT